MSLETANTAAELVDYWRHLARDTQRELSAERRKHAEQIAIRDARILALETQCDKLPSRDGNEVPMTMHDPTQLCPACQDAVKAGRHPGNTHCGRGDSRRLHEWRERAMSAEETVRRQRREHVNELAGRDARILALEHERNELCAPPQAPPYGPWMIPDGCGPMVNMGRIPNVAAEPLQMPGWSARIDGRILEVEQQVARLGGRLDDLTERFNRMSQIPPRGGWDAYADLDERVLGIEDRMDRLSLERRFTSEGVVARIQTLERASHLREPFTAKEFDEIAAEISKRCRLVALTPSG